MTEDERVGYLALRQQLIVYLEATQQQIIDYPVNENDDDYWFLTRKAIYYQDMIDNIDELLKADNN